MATRMQILVRGDAQGAGFRPHVFSLARKRSLRGHVFDNVKSVLIDVEGEKNAVEEFIDEIRFGPPRLSQIEPIERRGAPDPANYLEFRIVESEYNRRVVKTSFNFAREILACGSQLQNAFCLARDNQVFISHHTGDLENTEALHSFKQGIESFKRLFNLHPEVVVHDLDPAAVSTQYARTLGRSFTRISVQSHHAHIASCMAENGIDGPVIGVAMDGGGYGTDGCLWGGEFFVADFEQAERVAHLEYTPMPGGMKAIREPWRMAVIHLHRALGDEIFNWDLDFAKRQDRSAHAALGLMAKEGCNSPETSSLGRFFDAVASLIGVRDVAQYEGQGAIEMEALADESQEGGYEFDYSGAVIKPSPVICGVVADLLRRVPTPVIAARFHNTVANLIVEVARRIKAERELHRVALSGSVFQNRFLLNRLAPMLEAAGFEVFTNLRIPPHDGGIALGQAVVANALIKLK